MCGVMYRLERAGLAPRADTVFDREPALSPKGFVVLLGTRARLAVFLYASDSARAAEAAKLDPTQFVGAATGLTMRRERTRIESANLLALLTSLDDHQRERVSDALTAGPPQPARR